MNEAHKKQAESVEANVAAAMSVPAPLASIQKQQVELVFSQAYVAIGTAFVVAIILTMSLWSVADQSVLLTWFCAQLLLTVVRLFHVYQYRAATPESRESPQWEQFFFMGTLIAGITWGSIGLIYDPNWAVEYQVIVVICIIGLQAGAVSSYSAITGVYAAFTAPSVIIFSQALMTYPGQHQNIMGLLFLLGGAVLLKFSHNNSKSIIKSLQLRYEHHDLLRKLTITNNSLEIEISTRQTAENELLRERQLFTEGPVVVYRCRAEAGWPIEYISETISCFGYEAEDMMRNRVPFAELIHPDDLGRVADSEMLVGRNGTLSLNIDYRFLSKHGEARWVYDYLVPVVNGAGDVTHYSGYMFDITERKNTEFELQKERDRAQVTLHSIADAVITTDVNGQIEYLNPMAEELTGWVNEIAHGLSISRIFCLFDEESRDSVEDPVSHCLATADVYKSGKDATLKRHDGSKFSIQYTVSPINNEEGNPLGVVIVFTDVTGTRAMERTISYQAEHDTLTGLINRHEFERQIGRVLQEQDDDQYALLCVNIDQFKIVNDTCSHEAGDKMLVDVADVIRTCLRDSDILSRIGGDEYGVLLKNCSLKDAVTLADSMVIAVRNMGFCDCEHNFESSVSIGVVPVNLELKDVTSVVRAADLACYAAKDFGGNRIHVYQSDDQDLARRHTEMQWVSKLTSAIEDDRLVLYCQEIAPVNRDADTGSHFEVLVRMVGLDGELIQPGSFLPAAERYNLIASLDRWVISHSFEWYAENFRLISKNNLDTMSINLSGASVTDEGVMNFIKAEIQKYGVDPERICFEITETAAISNMDAAVKFIVGLKNLGCRFALDDFGSGLSSFAYLKNLPVDYLKIDGSFVKDMHTDAVDCAMVNAIHELGSLLGIKTIAEFVENDEILGKLEEIGVDYAQGYGISKPMPLDLMVVGMGKTA